MASQRRAVIDVGSNSVKLLVADVVAGQVTPLLQKGEQTRLGQGVFDTGRLQPERIAETARVVGKFADQARAMGAAEIRVLATSAAREAGNRDNLANAITEHGLELEIISGHAEAQLVLRGVRSHPDFTDGLLAVIDVGGGSTEIQVARDQQLLAQHSHPLGTVRWLDQFTPSDPPTSQEHNTVTESLDEFLDQQVVPCLNAVPLPTILVGTGGTPAFLARIHARRDDLPMENLETTSLSIAKIQELADRLWSLPLAGRQALPGLPANRADVILMGAAIYAALMPRLGFEELRPSLRGVRFGAMLNG